MARIRLNNEYRNKIANRIALNVARVPNPVLMKISS